MLASSNEIVIAKRDAFDIEIRRKLGDYFSPPVDALQPDNSKENPTYDYYGEEPFLEDEEFKTSKISVADYVDANAKPILVHSLTDILVSAEVILPHGEEQLMAKVLRKSVDENVQVIVTHNENPLLNTLVYNVKFPDGDVKKYAANLIAKNVLSQVDTNCYYTNTVKAILYHKLDGTAVHMSDKFFNTKQGKPTQRHTTVGWSFLIKWKNGPKEWVHLKVLKKSNPVGVAEYVTARGIEQEPAFTWWVSYTLCKRDVIVSDVSSRVRKASHKYGIEIPTSIKSARNINREEWQ